MEYDYLKFDSNLVKVELDDDPRVIESDTQGSSSLSNSSDTIDNIQIVRTYSLLPDSESADQLNSYKKKTNKTGRQVNKQRNNSTLPNQVAKNSNIKIYNNNSRMGSKSKLKSEKLSYVTKVTTKKPKMQMCTSKKLKKTIQPKVKAMIQHTKLLKELRQDINKKNKELKKLQNQVKSLQNYQNQSKLQFAQTEIRQHLMQKDLTDIKAKLVVNGLREESDMNLVSNASETKIFIKETSESNGGYYCIDPTLPLAHDDLTVSHNQFPRQSNIENVEQVPIDLSFKGSAQKLTNGNHFKCNHCEKLFVRKCSLTIHLRTHTGEPQFYCSFCKMPFYEQRRLIFHLLVFHSGKNGTKIKRKSIVSKKSTTGSGTQTLFCCFCDKRFQIKKVLQYHINQEHGDLLIKVK